MVTTADEHRANQDLAAWLMGSIFRAFHCDGCDRPIIASHTEWLNPVHVWAITTRSGSPMVAHCPYEHCGNGITRHSTPVTSH